MDPMKRIDEMAAAGRIGAGAVPSYRTAVRKVLGDRDPDTVDVEAAIRRFLEDNEGVLARPTLETYASRVRAVLNSESGLVDYRFPVRRGVMATLRLPPDLTDEEARRVSAFVASLAVGGAGE